MSWTESLKRMDVYPKTLEDFRVKTFSGAIVSLISGVLMLWLLMSELSYYMSVERHDELLVDTSRGEKVHFNIDITVYEMPCSSLSVDAMDVSGSQQIDVIDTLTTNDIKTKKSETEIKPGCRISGTLEVNKVAGNVHIAPGKSSEKLKVHVHEFGDDLEIDFNLSHTINHLSFGAEIPGIINPLDGIQKLTFEKNAMVQYFIKIVPTVFQNIKGEIVKTNQFSATQHDKYIHFEKGEQGLPGIFISYDLSPIMVRIYETRRSFFHFVTSVCAVVGGIFTVAGLIDSALYRIPQAIRKKIVLGKFS